jgi:hypothetical protein
MTPHWDSFGNRFRFQFAQLIFERMETLETNIDELLKIWAANNVAFMDGAKPLFSNAKQLLQAINDCSYGAVAWKELHLTYEHDADYMSPLWKTSTYTIYARNPLQVITNMAENSEFNGKWDVALFEEYTQGDECWYSNLMSGSWAWRTAVTEFCYSGVVFGLITVGQTR